MVNSSAFLQAVLREFPQLVEKIDLDSGLIHVELGEFAAFTQKAIDRGDLRTVNRCFRLVNDNFDEAEPKLKNAFHVSFLEDLKFPAGHHGSAERLLGGKLRESRRQGLEYLEELLGK